VIRLLLSVVAAAAAAAPLPPAHEIRVPREFRAEVYARGLRHPTALAFGPDRLLYATEDVGRLVAVARGSSTPRTLTSTLRTPLGLAWRGTDVFV
jgi:glucose/arabinose dehydrogenase